MITDRPIQSSMNINKDQSCNTNSDFVANLSQYSLVIFDWDGTLMDSTARIVSCMQSTAKIANLPVPSEQQVKGIIGLSMAAVLDKMFPAAGIERRTELTDIYRQHYIELDTTPSPLFEGTLPLLEELKSRNIKTAVATGKARAGLTRALESVDLLDYFEYSICADEAESKPHPEMVHRLLQQTGKSASQSLIIGDSVHDLGMAKNAGVASIGVTTGANKKHELEAFAPLHIIDDLSQLNPLFV